MARVEAEEEARGLEAKSLVKDGEGCEKEREEASKTMECIRKRSEYGLTRPCTEELGRGLEKTTREREKE